MTIEEPGGTPDAAGHVDLTLDANWDRSGRIKVRFITKGGREGRIFDQVQAEVTHVVETRATAFSRRILPAWRGRFDGRKFNITAAFNVNEERRGIVQLHLTEAK